jgi:hypothetical protein
MFLSQKYLRLRILIFILKNVRLSNRDGTNSGRQVAQATKFLAVVPDICGSSVWYLVRFTLPALGILKLLRDFFLEKSVHACFNQCRYVSQLHRHFDSLTLSLLRFANISDPLFEHKKHFFQQSRHL